jgi:hypothetical protein
MDTSFLILYLTVEKWVFFCKKKYITVEFIIPLPNELLFFVLFCKHFFLKKINLILNSTFHCPTKCFAPLTEDCATVKFTDRIPIKVWHIVLTTSLQLTFSWSSWTRILVNRHFVRSVLRFCLWYGDSNGHSQIALNNFQRTVVKIQIL